MANSNDIVPSCSLKPHTANKYLYQFIKLKNNK